MPLLSSLQRIYIWSDECSAQFRSHFTFVLLTHLYSDKDIEWNYNVTHHGKEPMNGIGETIKSKVFQKVKSRRTVIDNCHARKPCNLIYHGRNYQRVTYLEFYRLLFDEKPFDVHFYGKPSDPIVCTNEGFGGGPNHFPNCLNDCHVVEEWMECPLCKQWFCSEDCFSA